jgi:hypothetical protein
MLVFAVVSAAFGCSSALSPTLVPHSAALNQQLAPQVSGRWATKASMPTARAGLAIGVLHGRLFAVGGDDNHFNLLNTVEAYNPATDTWTTKASMPTARDDLAVGVIDGGQEVQVPRLPIQDAGGIRLRRKVFVLVK